MIKQGQGAVSATNPALLPNPPSIPSHDNVFGYEINQRGDLVRQPNPDKVFTGVKDDRVGPQNYEQNVPKVTKGVTKWKKPQSSGVIGHE